MRSRRLVAVDLKLDACILTVSQQANDLFGMDGYDDLGADE